MCIVLSVMEQSAGEERTLDETSVKLPKMSGSLVWSVKDVKFIPSMPNLAILSQ